MNDASKTGDTTSASMVMGGGLGDIALPNGMFTATCTGADGQVKWVETFHNLWTTLAKSDMLDKYLAGSAYTASLFMGLKGTGTAVVGDTQASHAGWLEVGLANAPTYSGTRKTPAFNAAAAGVKATSAAVNFAITSTGTVAGAFINNGGTSAIDNTTGLLFSAGDFSLSRSVVSGDQINVTYQATLT
jgi:hypothetical protein